MCFHPVNQVEGRGVVRRQPDVQRAPKDGNITLDLGDEWQKNAEMLLHTE